MLKAPGDRLRTISIHAPREGGDTGPLLISGYAGISIHAPREGGDLLVATGQLGLCISIHAPREGGDAYPISPSAYQRISIHAPREGGDHRVHYGVFIRHNFNPRPPRGGRP